MDDAAILTAIRDAFQGDYGYDQRHLDEHGSAEGFKVPDDAITAIMTGSIIESYPVRNRYLICGRVSSLRQNSRFHGLWLHVSVEYEEDAAPSLATAYRPDKDRWINERIRKKD